MMINSEPVATDHQSKGKTGGDVCEIHGTIYTTEQN